MANKKNIRVNKKNAFNMNLIISVLNIFSY